MEKTETGGQARYWSTSSVILVVCLGLLAGCGSAAQAAPVIGIEANYQIATPGTEIAVSLALNPNGSSAAGDWFGGTYNPNAGLFHYGLGNGLVQDAPALDVAALKPSYQGSVIPFGTTVPFGALPAGQNTLFFGVDTTMDGELTDGYTAAFATVTIVDDCLVSSLRKISSETYELGFNLSGLTGAIRYRVIGGVASFTQPWEEYSLNGNKIVFSWPAGQPFGFAITGTTASGTLIGMNTSCSAFMKIDSDTGATTWHTEVTPQ